MKARTEYRTLDGALAAIERARAKYCRVSLLYCPSGHRGLPVYVVKIPPEDVMNASRGPDWREAAEEEARSLRPDPPEGDCMTGVAPVD